MIKINFLCYKKVAKTATSKVSMEHLVGGCSSVGRAPQWHCGGHRFDPGQLHHHRFYFFLGKK
jgi:hypothetical protein